MKSSLKLLVVGVVLIVLAPQLKAQGTAFTYQGRLNDGASPATGIYDLKFAIYDAAISGNVVSSALTNAAIGVTNGLFTTTLDFGSVFNGSDRWLDIAVRTNGVTPFVTLSPRQLLTPAPYAVYAANAGTAVTATTANNIGSLNSSNIAQLNVLGTAAQATGLPVITSGFITGANVTYGGLGYIVPPSVTVSDSTGSNAIISANISGGAVVSFTVLNAGHGYSPSATLTVGLPPSNAYQTFAGMNNFTGVNSMTNPNNVFVGTFTGNGAGLTNVPLSAVAAWQIVSGVSLQALPNAGYLLTNNSLATVALPIAPNLGDVVRVSGSGTGGWKLTQSAGQSIFIGDVLGVGWRLRASVTNLEFVASSADGTKLVATGWDNQIYISNDSGVTWAPSASAPSTNWTSVASSSTGNKLAACVYGCRIYTSTDSGTTWTPQLSSPSTNWQAVASSADGTKLVAVVYGGRVYTSSDSGVTWMPQVSSLSTNWYAVASSADGAKLVAAVDTDNSPQPPTSTLYTSTDSGVTWTPRTTIQNFWDSICSSTDGTKLAAIGNGRIYTSTDSGVTWLSQLDSPSAKSIASSADGAKLVIVRNGGPIYISTDSGLTWIPQFGSPSAALVTSSADGSKLVALNSTQVFTYSTRSTSGASGYLLGNQRAAVELQYIGNGQFMLINYVGTIQAY